MSDPVAIVDLHLGKPPIANPDGSVPAIVAGGKPVAGPGATLSGTFNSAFHFSDASHLSAVPPAVMLDERRFCVRLVLRVTAPVNGRENLFESALPACSIHLVPPGGRGQFRVQAWVNNARNGWAGVDTATRVDLQLDKWFTLEFACDLDTIGVFIDGDRVAVSAFPDGAPIPASAADFVVGIYTDLKLWPFTGDIALVQVWNGLPLLVQQKLDEARATSEWFIRLKENTLTPGIALGARQGDITLDPASRMSLQRFSNLTIGHGAGLPAAFEIHGGIRDRWENTRGLAGLLGPLVSDESNGSAPGSRRNSFEQGVIYWSVSSGAWEIPGRPSLDYDRLGGSASVLRLPVGSPEKIPGGTVQRFQGGNLYYRTDATRAYEVHGDILRHYLATGGHASWGFPASDEEAVLVANTNSLIPELSGARQSRFEWQQTTFFWSPSTGTHQVQGAILAAYLASGGPGMPNDNKFSGLGLPITDETDVPAWSGFGRFNGFQHGSIVWKGGVAQICPEFKIRLGLVQTEEDEGIGQGENDLYFRINLTVNGTTEVAMRVPNRGSFDDDDTCDLNLIIEHLIVPNDPELRVELSVEVWDEDVSSGDDQLGTLSGELNIGNAWGLLNNPAGTFTATRLDEVKSFQWQVQPRQPPEAAKDFWSTGNRGTPTLTYDQYAAAFSDIDDDPEKTDPSDWAQREVFGRRIKRMAANGNCFGLCTEALFAWFGRGLGLPLARFQPSDWESIRNLVNIKQIYQFGCDAVAHHVDQREDRMTPSAIFRETRQRTLAGDPCVLGVWTGNYSGTGHAIVPQFWDDTASTWTIDCFDPNAANAMIRVYIDPVRETFVVTSGVKIFGGAMEFAPWSALDHRQESPAADPNMLLLGLLLIAVGADASTSGITDTAGDNLLMADNLSTEPRSSVGQFASLAPFDGDLDGEVLVRRVRPEIRILTGTDTLDLTVKEAKFLASHSSDGQQPGLVSPPLPSRLSRALRSASLSPESMKLTLRDLLHGLLSDSVQMEPEVAALGNWLRRQSSSRGPDFKHQLRGVRRGQFDYLARWRLTATRLRCPIASGELHKLDATGLADRMPLYRLTMQRDKLVSLEHAVRLGPKGDVARITLSNLPTRAGVPLNVSVRAGLAGVDVLTAGERVDVPVLLETWSAGIGHRKQRYTATIDGGMRLTPALYETGAALKSAPIETMFGQPGITTLLPPTSA
jgi:LGFP repeat